MLPPYAPLLQPYRFKVLLGGRAAGRSVAISQALAFFMDKAPIKALMLREIQGSIAESSKAEFERTIVNMGLERDYRFLDDRIENTRTGAYVIFAGLYRNYTKIKSIPGVDIAIVEECETVSRESLDVLIPTIRETGSEIWMAGNPRESTSAVAQMFVENEPPPDSIIIRTTYLDNSFVSKETLADAEHCRKTNPALYDHIWMGNYLSKGDSRMVRNIVCDSGPRRPVSLDDLIVIGVDIAREGGDDTCICVRTGHSIASIESFPSMDLNRLTEELNRLKRIWKPDRINVDSTGHGAWVPDALLSTGIIVESVNFGAGAREDRKYSNKRSELYGLAGDYFDQGGTIPSGELRLQEELEATWYTLDNKNRFLMLPKKEIKRRIGRSPDRSDAFVTSLWNPEGMFRKTLANPADQQRLTVNLLNMGSFGGRYQ